MKGGVSLTPMAGAQGELAGVLMIRAYHEARGDHERNEIIVPDAAHGTNPATATMCGMVAREIPTNKDGDVDIEALKQAVGPKTAGIMLTNPSTLGVFERKIKEISKIVHDAGGLLYYDGANLNAILGKVRPGDMGFDVIHMNLHKTFSTPHGGGGPGAGPVGVGPRLLPFLLTVCGFTLLYAVVPARSVAFHHALIGGVVHRKFTGYRLIDQWTSYGWNVFTLPDGHDYDQIVIAIDAGNETGLSAVTSIQDSAKQVGLELRIKTFDAGAFVLDVREPDEWVAGHIPGARNLPWSDHLDPVTGGLFLPAETIRDRYAAVGVHDAGRAILHCGSGITGSGGSTRPAASPSRSRGTWTCRSPRRTSSTMRAGPTSSTTRSPGACCALWVWRHRSSRGTSRC